jgi:putative tricarboxylic transport membrane protein
VRRADLFIGLGLLAFAGAYYRASFDIAMGFASDRLGPTFFPRLLAAALAACALGLVARAARDRSDPGPLPPVRTGTLVLVVGLTVGYGLALRPLGYPVATALFLAAVIRALGHRDLRTLAGVAVGVTAVLYLVFARALHVLVPMGPLGGR